MDERRFEHAADEGPASEPPLSEQGFARRDAMLAGLLEEVPRAASARRRLRTAVVATGGVAALALIASVAPLLWNVGPRKPQSTSTRAAIDPVAPSSIERVATDSSIVARLAPTSPAIVERLSDDDLLRTLSAIGRPVGMTREGGRIALTADVADKPAPDKAS